MMPCWLPEGIHVQETARDVAFCAHTILQDRLLEVCDARLDERFADNPLVTGDPQIRFYAGIPVCTRAGLALGTICVIDIVPRRLIDEMKEIVAGHWRTEVRRHGGTLGDCAVIEPSLGKGGFCKVGGPARR